MRDGQTLLDAIHVDLDTVRIVGKQLHRDHQVVVIAIRQIMVGEIRLKISAILAPDEK